jgi:hypothetical protein
MNDTTPVLDRDTRTMITWSLICGILLAVVIGLVLWKQPDETSPERKRAERAAIWACPVEPPKWSDEHAEYERCIDIEADRIMEAGQDD